MTLFLNQPVYRQLLIAAFSFAACNSQPTYNGDVNYVFSEADDDGSGDIAGGEDVERMIQASGALCDKGLECDETMSSEDMDECIEMMNFATMVIPDLPSFERCIWNASCDELMEDLEAEDPEAPSIIEECLDWDLDTFVCSGDRLNTCTNNGVCQEIDCVPVCEYVYGSYHSCQFDEEDNHDKCWCWI
jgi:hypothetical protein